MPEGMLVLGAGRRRVLAVNQAFSELTGRNPSDRRILAVEPLDLIAPEDHSLFLSLGEIGITQEQERVRLRILHESGEARVMEAQGRYLPAGGQNGRWVYFFRPLPNRSDREQILHDQVNHQKLKTMDAVKISLQIYQIAEKIRSTSRLSALLLNLHSEEELFQRAGDFLRGEGLNFRQVAILMLEGETLRLVHSSTGEVERTYSLREENRYSRFLTDPRENSPAENVRLVALSCRNKTVGVLEI
ncbi:MAG: PAS domain-containing protein, partial [Planctomycetota bacterium]